MKIEDLYDWAEQDGWVVDDGDEFEGSIDGQMFNTKLGASWWVRFRMRLSYRIYPYSPKMLFENCWSITNESKDENN